MQTATSWRDPPGAFPGPFANSAAHAGGFRLSGRHRAERAETVDKDAVAIQHRRYMNNLIKG